jgi:hypothetical protein
MRFYFDGQIEGRMIRTPVQLGRWADEPSDARSMAIYERLLATASTPLLRHGEWKLLETSSAGDSSFGDLIAFRWRLGDAVAVVVANLGIGNATGHVPIVADLPAGNTFDFTDRLTDVTYRWARRSLDVRGLYVRLEPGAAHVFVATVTNGRME